MFLCNHNQLKQSYSSVSTEESGTVPDILNKTSQCTESIAARQHDTSEDAAVWRESGTRNRLLIALLGCCFFFIYPKFCSGVTAGFTFWITNGSNSGFNGKLTENNQQSATRRFSIFQLVVLVLQPATQLPSGPSAAAAEPSSTTRSAPNSTENML